MKKSKIFIFGLVIASFIVSVTGCLSNTNEMPDNITELVTTNEETKPTSDKQYHSIAYITVPASDTWRWIGTDGPDDNDAVSNADTRYLTHINFAFGMLKAYQFESDNTGEPLMEEDIVSPEAYLNPEDGKYHYTLTLQGYINEMNKTVDGREYLAALVKLKEQKPELKILLSVGGWDSDGFCYMAKTSEGRSEFINSCIDIVREYKIDGIDLDWEYPTNGGWGEIASCGNCISDAQSLIKEMRAAFDAEFANEHKLVTIASGCSQSWVDSDTFNSLDYMNVMCYDYNPGNGGSQAGLDDAKGYMYDHLMMVGDTEQNRSKINLGIPFYNEGGPHLVPYYKGWNGHVDASPEITKDKMEWVKNEGFGGAFYWTYSMDTFEQDVTNPDDPQIKILQKTVYDTLNAK